MHCVCRLGVIVFYVSDVFLVTYLQAAFFLSDVRPVASVTCDFIDAAFVMVWGGVVSLSFREVFYCIGASECYSYVCVFEWVNNFAYFGAVICEVCPCFMIVVSFCR
jgi:hypothetical protein